MSSKHTGGPVVFTVRFKPSRHVVESAPQTLTNSHVLKISHKGKSSFVVCSVSALLKPLTYKEQQSANVHPRLLTQKKRSSHYSSYRHTSNP